MFWQKFRNEISDKIETHSAEMMVDRIMTTMEEIGYHLETEKNVKNSKINGVDAQVRRVLTGNINLAELITSRLYDQTIAVEASATVGADLDNTANSYSAAKIDVDAQVKSQQQIYAANVKRIGVLATQAQTALQNGDMAGYKAVKSDLRDGLLSEYETMRPKLARVAAELTNTLSRVERSQKGLPINGPFSDSIKARVGTFVANTSYHLENAGAKLFSPGYESRISMGAEADPIEFTQAQDGGIHQEAAYVKMPQSNQTPGGVVNP